MLLPVHTDGFRKLRERLALQARAVPFNIFNHPNFGSPINYLSSPLFAQSTHAQQRIGIEIRILRLAFHELRTLVQSRAQSPQRGASDLRRGAVRMNNRASVNDKRSFSTVT